MRVALLPTLILLALSPLAQAQTPAPAAAAPVPAAAAPAADPAKLVACREDSITGYMSYVNLGEVYYKTIRAAGIEKAKIFLDNFLRLPITLVLPDSDIIWRASEIKAQFSILVCRLLRRPATAIRYEAVILTGDPEFKKLRTLVSVEGI